MVSVYPEAEPAFNDDIPVSSAIFYTDLDSLRVFLANIFEATRWGVAKW